ncbi:flagellar motor switch protein FliN [Nitrosomonas sp. sh817]|uniref:flagellar motor switch protein FliN n=1 Tax=Nitrosomonas sp. sh817 TaxID=3070658 RepID=UPI0027DC490B|nr:flagellar motor switch protein FliN [Nitrosomonas sp. sh817]WMJ08499.1 flagellar motor switch protein FliN [Nitrosomonas sp. sh817]
MTEPTTSDQAETDDWAAAMAEQTAAENSNAQNEENPVDDWAAAMAEQESATNPSDPQSSGSALNAQSASASVFQEFSKDSADNNTRHDIDLILDIPVQMTVELGRTKIAIKNLLQLAQGSVVELDGMAGEPMDVLVNGCLIAQGEVVVVNDKFGIRLTDIITPSERIRKLNR